MKFWSECFVAGTISAIIFLNSVSGFREIGMAVTHIHLPDNPYVYQHPKPTSGVYMTSGSTISTPYYYGNNIYTVDLDVQAFHTIDMAKN
jgi:hypothetical protein